MKPFLLLGIVTTKSDWFSSQETTYCQRDCPIKDTGWLYCPQCGSELQQQMRVSWEPLNEAWAKRFNRVPYKDWDELCRRANETGYLWLPTAHVVKDTVLIGLPVTWEDHWGFVRVGAYPVKETQRMQRLLKVIGLTDRRSLHLFIP